MPQVTNEKLAKKTKKSSVSFPLSDERKRRAGRNREAYLCVFKHRHQNNSTAFLPTPLRSYLKLQDSYLSTEQMIGNTRAYSHPKTHRCYFLGPSTVSTCAQPQLHTVCWTGGNCTTARLQDGIFSTLSVTQSCLCAFHLSPLAGSWVYTCAGNRAATVNSYSLAHQQVF